MIDSALLAIFGGLLIGMMICGAACGAYALLWLAWKAWKR